MLFSQVDYTHIEFQIRKGYLYVIKKTYEGIYTISH